MNICEPKFLGHLSWAVGVALFAAGHIMRLYGFPFDAGVNLASGAMILVGLVALGTSRRLDRLESKVNAIALKCGD
jgi:hypothetical protein